MKLITFIFCFLCVGCSTIQRAPSTEWVWQGLHVVDVMQTSHMKDSICNEESDPITKRLIGKNPSKDKVYAWGVATSLLHFFATDYLDKNFPDYSDRIRFFDLGVKSHTVIRNYNGGLSPFGADECEIIHIDEVTNVMSIEIMEF